MTLVLIGLALFGEGLGPIALVGTVLVVFVLTAALDTRHTAHLPGMQTEAAPVATEEVVSAREDVPGQAGFTP